MPVATAEQFWDLLSAARLVSADEITALRRDDSTATPEQIAQRLVQTGRVTRWQANMLLAGRTRFFLGKYKLLDKLATEPDSAYVCFLETLSNEAADEATSDTDPHRYAATISQSDADRLNELPKKEESRRKRPSKLQRELAARTRGERRRFRWIAAGLVAFIAMIAALGIWIRTGKTTVVIVWPKSERDGSRLQVDSNTVDLPDRERFALSGDPGTRSVRLTRAGYEPVEAKWNLGRGEEITFRLQWKPTAATVRRQALASLDKRVKEFLQRAEKIRRAEGRKPPESSQNQPGQPRRSPDFQSPELTRLRADLCVFRQKSAGRPEADKSATLFRRLPSPFDNLNPATRPPTDPPLEKAVPLVAVLGTRDLRLKHWGAVGSVSFSPDGKWLAVSSRGLFLRDVATGKTIRTLPFSGLGLAISPDGSLLATSDGGGTVRVIDPKSGTVLHTWKLGPDRRSIRQIAFTPDGRHLLTANGNGTLYVLRLRDWDTSSKQNGK